MAPEFFRVLKSYPVNSGYIWIRRRQRCFRSTGLCRRQYPVTFPSLQGAKRELLYYIISIAPTVNAHMPEPSLLPHFLLFCGPVEYRAPWLLCLWCHVAWWVLTDLVCFDQNFKPNTFSFIVPNIFTLSQNTKSI